MIEQQTFIPGKLYRSLVRTSFYYGKRSDYTIKNYAPGEIFLFLEVGSAFDNPKDGRELIFLDSNGIRVMDRMSFRTVKVYIERFEQVGP